MTFENARYADGPLVAEWLDAREIVPQQTTHRKKLALWRQGRAADIYTLDAIIITTKYGLWDLPDAVWLKERSAKALALSRRTDVEVDRSRLVRYPQLQDAAWLEREYVVNGRGLVPIAKELGCCPKSVRLALRRHGISVRPPCLPAKVAA